MATIRTFRSVHVFWNVTKEVIQQSFLQHLFSTSVGIERQMPQVHQEGLVGISVRMMPPNSTRFFALSRLPLPMLSNSKRTVSFLFWLNVAMNS